MPSQQHPPWVLRSRVPEEVYTDRQEFLDYFYRIALKAIERKSMSTVLLGQRRMGKTEIFKRVVNRLFWEQDHRDPQAAVPIFYSFKDEIIDRWEFAIEYVENFIRWYGAFRLRDPRILSRDFITRDELADLVQPAMPAAAARAFNLLRFLQAKDVTLPEEAAVTMPQRASDFDDNTIVVFLDEFQNTRLPQYNFSIVGFMQEAVESYNCPHFVTGSAMSILAREIIGRGSLFGRFRSHPIEPMTKYWGAELALRAARYYGAKVTEEMTPVVADRCGGNPFYITAVIQQTAEQGKVLGDEETLNEMLAVDLSSGFIWGELNDQVSRWIERINEYGITKWILYLSALEEGDRLNLERIRQELKQREGKDVPLETIREVLIKLSRGDLLQYMELGGWFRKVDDPILLEFLRVWGRIEVEGQDRGRIRDNLITRYQKLKRRISEHLGYLAEVYMAQILLNSQRQSLPGKFFHQGEDIEIPDFIYVRLRERLSAGPDREIDVLGAAGKEKWVCESKWLTTEPVGRDAVKVLLKKAQWVQEELDPSILRMWFFAHNGFTKDALTLIEEKGIFWSTRANLDALLQYVGLRALPNLD